MPSGVAGLVENNAVSTKKRVTQHLEFHRKFGGKTVIDKSSQTVTIIDRFLFWTVRQWSVPFSTVMVVMMDEKIRRCSPGEIKLNADTWEISIDIGGKKLKLIESRDKPNTLKLAVEISLLMEKKLTRSYLGVDLIPFPR